MATIEDVRRIALSFPETSEGPLYGTPGFRVKDKAFARLRPEGDVLVVWCADEGEKEALLATQPEIFFTLPHYDGHPSVLVRLPAIEVEELRAVLAEAWSVRAPRRLRETLEAAADPHPPAPLSSSQLERGEWPLQGRGLGSQSSVSGSSGGSIFSNTNIRAKSYGDRDASTRRGRI